MILNDDEIENLATPQTGAKLIEPFDGTLLKNCGYSLTIGHIVEPASGAISPNATTSVNTSDLESRVLAPSECVLVVTHETVTMPSHLMALYMPLNRLARDGLMLLNPSVIEPGYSGPLTCSLANLSAKPIRLPLGRPIVKIIFVRLSNSPKQLQSATIDRQQYLSEVADAAVGYHASFMDIDGIAAKAKDAALSGINGAVKFGGVLLAFLLVFAQLEPFLTKWLWQDGGTPLSPNAVGQVQNELARRETDLARQAYELQIQKEIDELKLQNANLQAQLIRMNGRNKP